MLTCEICESSRYNSLPELKGSMWQPWDRRKHVARNLNIDYVVLIFFQVYNVFNSSNCPTLCYPFGKTSQRGSLRTPEIYWEKLGWCMALGTIPILIGFSSDQWVWPNTSFTHTKNGHAQNLSARITKTKTYQKYLIDNSQLQWFMGQII